MGSKQNLIKTFSSTRRGQWTGLDIRRQTRRYAHSTWIKSEKGRGSMLDFALETKDLCLRSEDFEDNTEVQ